MRKEGGDRARGGDAGATKGFGPKRESSKKTLGGKGKKERERGTKKKGKPGKNSEKRERRGVENAF